MRPPLRGVGQLALGAEPEGRPPAPGPVPEQATPSSNRRLQWSPLGPSHPRKRVGHPQSCCSCNFYAGELWRTRLCSAHYATVGGISVSVLYWSNYQLEYLFVWLSQRKGNGPSSQSSFVASWPHDVQKGWDCVKLFLTSSNSLFCFVIL